MIQFKNIAYHYDTKIIFENMSETLPTHQKIGIVGKNGSGKTTLFKLITGLLETSRGEIVYPKKWRFAHLSQTMPVSEDLALDYVMLGDERYADITAKIHEALKNQEYETLAELHQLMSDIDGYAKEARAAKVLAGLGFSDEDQIRAVNEFSGGWRMRLKLARILLSQADLLLLDEPTNHLDLPCIVWLENWLKQYAGMVLIVSHDRDFLDNTVDYVLYIHELTAKLYTGNYSTFETQRALELENQQKTFEKQQAKIAHLMSFVERFRYKASKAKQAQSRLKAIEKIPKIAAVSEEMDISFSFENIECPAGTLLSLQKAEFGYPTAMFKRVNFSIYKDQRIGLLGANGAGKTTFIKALAGELPLQYGERLLPAKLKIAYFSQNSHEKLILEDNALQHLQDLSPRAELAKIRAYLGNFGFSQEMALKPMEKCSGGEKVRLILAMMVWQKPDVLLLDEPTNHLDLAMNQALSLALQVFQGGIVLISHDRFLLNSCVNELWLIDKGDIKPFAGDLKDYQQWLLERR